MRLYDTRRNEMYRAQSLSHAFCPFGIIFYLNLAFKTMRRNFML